MKKRTILFFLLFCNSFIKPVDDSMRSLFAWGTLGVFSGISAWIGWKGYQENKKVTDYARTTLLNKAFSDPVRKKVLELCNNPDLLPDAQHENFDCKQQQEGEEKSDAPTFDATSSMNTQNYEIWRKYSQELNICSNILKTEMQNFVEHEMPANSYRWYRKKEVEKNKSLAANIVACASILLPFHLRNTFLLSEQEKQEIQYLGHLSNTIKRAQTKVNGYLNFAQGNGFLLSPCRSDVTNTFLENVRDCIKAQNNE